MNDDEILRSGVEQMFAQRQTLAPALAAFAQEMPVGRARRDLARLSRGLASDGGVDELLRSPTMTAAAMPLLSGAASLGTTSYLHDLFDDAARDNALRTQRARVLAYPLVVIGMAAVVLILLCAIIVPAFASIFADFELELPGMTIVLVSFSLELRRNPLAMLAAVALVLGVSYGVVYLVRSTGVLHWLVGGLTKGSSRQVMAMANFERRLAEALRAGLSLPGALRLSGRTAARGWLSREAQRFAAEVQATGAPPQYSQFPATLLYALRAGPDGAPNVALIQELADMYAERVHSRFDWSSGFVPQFAVFMVGLVVGFVVLSLFLPLVQLLNGLSG